VPARYRDGGERSYFVLTRRGAQCLALRIGCSSRFGLAGASRDCLAIRAGAERVEAVEETDTKGGRADERMD
jgi:hypothetical protein